MRFLKHADAIAIDGPAGSGKSTVSRLVAERLGVTYIDTGAMYRALTLKVMRNNIDFADEKEIIALSCNLDLKLIHSADGENTIRIMIDGQDVSLDIRRMEVTVNVKHVAGLPAVRKNMVRLQKKMVQNMKGAVMEGRDIGTVVLTGAAHKFYIDASFDERVRRRFDELKTKGQNVTKEEVADDLRERDYTDKTRKTGPLKKAEDAVYLDTTNLSIEEVVAKIIRHIKVRNQST